MDWHAVLQVIESLAISGLSSFAVFAILLPTKAGEKLLAHHFDARISSLKHEQGKELSRLQSELDHLKDRGIRSNEREYNAVTCVWGSFVEAFSATRRCVVQFMTHPDLASMPEDELMEFLAEEEITERQAKRILASTDRNAAYRDARRGELIYQAAEAIFKTINILDKESVFIPHPLFLQFKNAID